MSTSKPLTADELDALSERPWTEAELLAARRVPEAKRLRLRLALTQQAFAERYHIPLGTLRDWEQARSEPDAPAQAYLKVIAASPETVAEALAGKAAA
ncbi:MAG: helix-turn-helix domain-containing protein [Beijerinckiaceae bacterium]